MTWISAVPSVDGFLWARKLFPTNNVRGVCAAFSQTWLTLSLIGGAPVKNPGILRSPGQIQAIHQGRPRVGAQPSSTPLGSSSLVTLPESGLKIQTGYPKLPYSTNWKDIYAYLASQPDGHYYLTIKSPFRHAMACIILGSEVYYLEPQKGLYVIPKAKTSDSLTAFYSQYTWSSGNDYKIYQVGT
ncbi:MAG: hypothetical protein NTU79_09700 [Planctomycetota bacterium]|nr:hypothetical protein [Planctomycetota bacterium]